MKSTDDLCRKFRGGRGLQDGGFATQNLQKSIKNRSKNQSKNWYILESIFGRILVDFWWKMEVCWHQNRSKIDPNFEKRFFEKTSFFLRNNYNFEGSGDRSWREIRWKIDQKMKPTWEGILASIFDGFWRALGGKLGGKIEPRGITMKDAVRYLSLNFVR